MSIFKRWANNMKEYCVVDEFGNNIDCFDWTDEGYENAEILAKEYFGRVLEVTYNKHEQEIACECVWEWGD